MKTLPPPKVAAFSLVEMLTVVALIGILMSVSVPSLMNSQKASALTHGGNLMADLSTYARQTALSRNIITALIVAKRTGTDKQSVTVIEYDPIAKTWKQSSQWNKLPDAIEANETTPNPPDNTTLTSIATVELKIAGKNLGASDYTSFVFYPDGRMDNGSNDTRRLRVKQSPGSASNYYDLVYNSDTSSFRILRP